MDPTETSERTESPPLNDLPLEFEILETLGRGGAGAVYRCRQRPLDRIVAVKVLDSGSEMTSAPERFKREAQVLAALDHPNIQKILGYGLEPRPHLVSEFLSGTTLSEQMKQGLAVTGKDFAATFTNIAAGLDYIHEKGIVHRDLKPGNIIIERTEEASPFPKIIDFGLACVVSSDISKNQKLTSTSAILGSPLYMSPEQCKGEALGPASDIYSLGCVMYEYLSGRPPFAGDSELETMYLRSHNKPLPLTGQISLPQKLDRIILQCLELKPDKRPTAKELKQSIEKLSLSADSFKSPVKNRRFMFAAGVVLATILTAAITIAQRSGDNHRPSQSNTEQTTDPQLYLNQAARQVNQLYKHSESPEAQRELLKIAADLEKVSEASVNLPPSKRSELLFSKCRLLQRILSLRKDITDQDQKKKLTKDYLNKQIEAATMVAGVDYAETADACFEQGVVLEAEERLSEAAASFAKACEIKRKPSAALKRLNIDTGSVDRPDEEKSLWYFEYRLNRVKLRQGEHGSAEKIDKLLKERLNMNHGIHDTYSVAMINTIATCDKSRRKTMIGNLEAELRSQHQKMIKGNPGTKQKTMEAYLGLCDYYVQSKDFKNAERCIDTAISISRSEFIPMDLELIQMRSRQLIKNLKETSCSREALRITQKYSTLEKDLKATPSRSV